MVGYPQGPSIGAKSPDLVQKIAFIPAIEASQVFRLLKSPLRKGHAAMLANRVKIRGDIVEAGKAKDVGKTLIE